MVTGDGPTGFDPYVELGVPPSASPAEITRAYRDQLRRHHPDLRGPDTDGTESSRADERLRKILTAYTILRDPARRARHDHSTRSRRPSPAPPPPLHSDPSWLRAGPVHWQRRR